jgi:hypothetical protein
MILFYFRKWKTGLSVRTPSAAMPTTSTPALTPTHSSMNAANASSAGNPFATTSFASTVGNVPSDNNDGNAFKNPFATVSFAATPANKSTSASTLIATSTKKQRPFMETPSSVVTKSNTSSVISTSPVPPSKPLPPLRPGAIQGEKIPIQAPIKAALEVLTKFDKEGIVNPLSDYTPLSEKYIRDKMSDQSVSNGGKVSFGSNVSSAVIPSATAAKDAPFSSAFSTENSNGPSSSNAKPIFSFSSPPAESSGTKPFVGFSFGKSDHVAPALNSTPEPAIDTVTNDDESDGGEPTVVLASNENKDEIDLFSCRAKYLRRIAKDSDPTVKEWKTCSTGVLRVYKNQKDDKVRVVLRDAVGKVRLNLPIAKGTTFTKTQVKNGVGGVQFMSVMDEEIGPELFMLRAKLEYFDKLCETLESVASK